MKRCICQKFVHFSKFIVKKYERLRHNDASDGQRILKVLKEMLNIFDTYSEFRINIELRFIENIFQSVEYKHQHQLSRAVMTLLKRTNYPNHQFSKLLMVSFLLNIACYYKFWKM